MYLCICKQIGIAQIQSGPLLLGTAFIRRQPAVHMTSNSFQQSCEWHFLGPVSAFGVQLLKEQAHLHAFHGQFIDEGNLLRRLHNPPWI
jgi:hypothetical protein